MVYVTFDENTLIADNTAYGSENLIPAGKNYIQVTESEWNAAIGKKATIEQGCFVIHDISVEELRAQLEDTLWSNYKTYQRTYVDPEDLTLANTCAAGGSAKGAAVQQWVLALWARYYEVKDLLAAAETLEALRAVDISTATLTPPPYTIRELNEEAAAFLAHGE